MIKLMLLTLLLASCASHNCHQDNTKEKQDRMSSFPKSQDK